MLKFAVAVLAVALAGSASAAGWRSLQVDGSSEQAFAKSLEAFKEEMSPAREYVLGEALKDIWTQGAKVAEAEQREYTADEYYRQLDGLRYKEIVKYTDPTGDTAKYRYRLAAQSRYPRSAAAPTSSAPAYRSSPWEGVPPPPPTWQPRGGTDLTGPGLPGDPRFQ